MAREWVFPQNGELRGQSHKAQGHLGFGWPQTGNETLATGRKPICFCYHVLLPPASCFLLLPSPTSQFYSIQVINTWVVSHFSQTMAFYFYKQACQRPVQGRVLHALPSLPVKNNYVCLLPTHHALISQRRFSTRFSELPLMQKPQRKPKVSRHYAETWVAGQRPRLDLEWGWGISLTMTPSKSKVPIGQRYVGAKWPFQDRQTDLASWLCS